MEAKAKQIRRLIDQDTLRAVSRRAGVQEESVRKVLHSALPALLEGFEEDAGRDEAGLENALAAHAARDASDMQGFLQAADTADGEKILSHLLGGKKEALLESTAKKAGLSGNKTLLILALCAPLLLSLLGKDGKEEQESNGGSILGNLLGGSGGGLAAALLSSMLGGASPSQQGGDLGGALLQSLLGNITEADEPKEESPSLGGGLLGALLGGGKKAAKKKRKRKR